MSSRIVIERIATEEALQATATAADLAVVEQFGSASRRCEALAWRAIVRRELGEEVTIGYDANGAPIVNVPNIYISVSHSRDMVAVLFSERTCAVDIESASRDFCRVVDRYLSQEERQIADEYGLYAEMWSAKEAMYKFYRKGGLDLINDISIKAFNADRGVLCGSILGGEEIEVSVKCEDGLVVAMID